jgi:3-O-methylgallate 3,4-dioxygenase
MAHIGLGIGTSHAPQLSTPPEEWGQRARADRRNPALVYRGGDHSFEELTRLRGAAFAAECDPQVQRERHARGRVAIDELGRIVRESGVDVLVVVSSDHKETFTDELLPQFAVYWGDTVAHEPFTQEDLDAMPPGLAIAEVANVPTESTICRCHSELALHLIRETSATGFDPAASRVLPAGKYGNHGIPHGWGFVLQQVLGGTADIPIVPVFVNSFWEPNPPGAARCHDFGVALGAAIRSFPRDIEVGVVASGGLSHFVVDEELDRGFLKALVDGDSEYLRSMPADLLRAGTSELRNWIVVGGAVAGSALRAQVVDYLPCYRSEAGTGCGMGFVAWQEASQRPDRKTDVEGGTTMAQPTNRAPGGPQPSTGLIG